jgi:hypothetical protein
MWCAACTNRTGSIWAAVQLRGCCHERMQQFGPRREPRKAAWAGVSMPMASTYCPAASNMAVWHSSRTANTV